MENFTRHFKNKTVLVIGDLMLDEFLYGITTRRSPEAPSAPVIHIQKNLRFLGGAANVANNIVSLGAKAVLLGCLGDDDEGKQFRNLLAATKVEDFSFISPTRPTTTKTRIFSAERQIARVDREETAPFKKSTLDAFSLSLKRLPRNIDFVIISDYAKGMISEKTMGLILKRFPGTKILADPKPIHKNLMKGLAGITPNLNEVSLMAGTKLKKHDHIREVTKTLSLELGTSVITTMGREGMIVWDYTRSASHRVPPPKVKAVDVTGAGDVATAACALALASGASLSDAAHFANRAASISVTKRGTSTITLHEILNKK